VVTKKHIALFESNAISRWDLRKELDVANTPQVPSLVSASARACPTVSVRRMGRSESILGPEEILSGSRMGDGQGMLRNPFTLSSLFLQLIVYLEVWSSLLFFFFFLVVCAHRVRGSWQS
jgi:hypothetical protein